MEGFDTYTLLKEEIGEEAAQRVFELFAGGTVHFPKRITIFFRNVEIIKRFERGDSYESLARSYRLSPQQIRNILSRSSTRDIEHKQRTLFDF